MNTQSLCPAFVVTATIGLGLFAPLPADDQRDVSTTRIVIASTLETDPYRRFAGKRTRQERDDNVLKIKFVWCFGGPFRMGPIQIVDGKQVNENQEIEDLGRLMRKLGGGQDDRVAEPPDEELDEDELDGRVQNGKKDAGHADRIDRPRDNRVVLHRGYWLGKFEVKRAEWKQLMQTTP
jgi:formylglycine-generating enzyme required for sulfatase activity